MLITKYLCFLDESVKSILGKKKKRGQNWIVVTQHKMFRSSSFQASERKIFAQL